MGTAAGYLGQGVGIGIGFPLDAAYNLLWSICSLISRHYSKTPELAPIDGIRIVDGAMIIAGIPIQWVAENALPEGCTKKILEITEEGEIHIEGEEEIESESPMQIPPEVIEELKKQLENSSTQAPESTGVQQENDAKDAQQKEEEEELGGAFSLV